MSAGSCQGKAAARMEVIDLLAWKPVAVDWQLMKSAWKIQDRFGFSFRDSLIVASAKASRCQWILTEDFQTARIWMDSW